MLNLYDLERRWLRYKIKSYLPHLVIVISVTLIITLFFIMDFVQKETEVEKKTEIKQVTIVKKVQKKPELHSVDDSNLDLRIEIENVKAPLKESKNDKVVLAPSLNFMNKMQKNAIPSHRPYVDAKIQLPKPKVKVKVEETPKKVKQESKVKQKSVKIDSQQKAEAKTTQQKSSINIVRQTTQNDINEVVKRFNKNNSPALSLFVAKKYYELGEYRKAYNYALKTNNLNNDIEASWIIFAKSLVKLDEREMAIKILNKYVKHSNSNRARVLLNNVVSGKFK